MNTDLRDNERPNGSASAVKAFWLVLGIGLLAGLTILGEHSYLTFHSLVELFSIGVSIAIFLVAWNVRQRMGNDFLLFIAVAYAAICLLDLIHTLAYPGLGAIPGVNMDPPTQLWIAARYLQAACLLLAPVWLTRRLPLKTTLLVLALIDAAVLLTVFRPWPWLPAFPACHLGVPKGLTPFKVISEYVISGILLAALGVLWLRRKRLDRAVFGYMAASMFVTMASEIAFTSYVSVQAPSNLIGHLLKIVAVYLAYKALLEAGLRRPYDVLFRDLAESEHRFRLLTDATFEGIAISEAGRFIDCNDQLAHLLGYSRPELIGMDIGSLVAPADRQRVMANIREDREAVVEHDFIRKDGSLCSVEAHGQTIVSAGRRLRFTAIRDVTERKRADLKLRQSAEELARSNQELEQFAYIASHDLQEPLRMVSGFLQLLQRRYAGQLDDKADEFIGFAVDGAQRMRQMILDLLAYSRAGGKGLTAAAVDLRQPLQQALSALQARVAESAARIDIGELPTVEGDAGQLSQVFLNLIGNALKFRRDGVQPELSIASRRQDGHWLLWVQDNGIGIEPAQSARVFDLFHRVHSRDKYPGTGIGLAICKKIVERHGGKIWVESQPGAGSKFLFTIPA